jgi:hypothetical protein
MGDNSARVVRLREKAVVLKSIDRRVVTGGQNKLDRGMLGTNHAS